MDDRAKRKVEFLEPPTSLKEAARELKHVEQIGTPVPIWTKPHRCDAGRNQALKLMPKEPISILFLLIRSRTLLSSSPADRVAPKRKSPASFTD